MIQNERTIIENHFRTNDFIHSSNNWNTFSKIIGKSDSSRAYTDTRKGDDRMIEQEIDQELKQMILERVFEQFEQMINQLVEY